MQSTTFYIIRSSILGTLTLLAVLFVPAGTFAYWQGWAFMAVFIAACSAYTIYVAKHDPALLKRRTEAGISHEKESAQKVIIFLFFVGCALLVLLAPLDHRFRWSNVLWYISVAGNALVAVSFYVFYLVSKVNTYAAANVRVEAGQKVIDTGLYGSVRHPMYFGALLLVAGTPLALGSWWALLVAPLFLPVLYVRMVNEEAVLKRDLPGYEEYTHRVKNRLIPGLF